MSTTRTTRVVLACPPSEARERVADLLGAQGLEAVNPGAAPSTPGEPKLFCGVGPDVCGQVGTEVERLLREMEEAASAGALVRGVLLCRTTSMARLLGDDIVAARAAARARWRETALRVARAGASLNGVDIGASDEWPTDPAEHVFGTLVRQGVRRPCAREDIEGAIGLLLSEASSYLTAQTIELDGGQGLGVVPPVGARVRTSLAPSAVDGHDLTGRVVVVVGASSGIGRAAAVEMARRGACLVVAARRGPLLDELTGEVRRSGGQARAVVADVTSAEAPVRVMEQAVDAFGSVDALVYASGLIELDEQLEVGDRWRRQFAVNVEGFMRHAAVFAATRRRLRLDGGGSITLISSIDAVRVPSKFNEAYSASKAAAQQCARSLAHTLVASRIRVNAVLPGNVETEMTAWIPDAYQAQWRAYIPARRLGRPEELAGILAYLAGDASSHVTGQAFLVDGGFHLDEVRAYDGDGGLHLDEVRAYDGDGS